MRVNTGGGGGGGGNNGASSSSMMMAPTNDEGNLSDEASPLRGARAGRLGSSLNESPLATKQQGAFSRSRGRGSFNRGVGRGSSATNEAGGGGRGTATTAPALPPPPRSPSPPPRRKAQQQKHRRKAATFFMMNLAMAFERTDEVVLPAVYSFVAASFGANLLQLSYLTLARALTQALLSPLGGWLGHAFNRVAVLSLGCLVWGAAMGAFALSTTLGQGVACWAVTGAGLCIVVPNAQSLTADLHDEGRRGAAFGTLHLTSALGAALGGLYATNVGALRPLGWDGWRVAMALLAAAALGVGALNAAVSADPRALPGSRWRLAPAVEDDDDEGWGDDAALSPPPPLPLELLLGESEAEARAAAAAARAAAAAARSGGDAEEEAVALTASALDDYGDASPSSSVTPFVAAPKGRAGAAAAGAAATLPVSAPLPPPPSSSPLSPSPNPSATKTTFLSDFLFVLRVPTFVIIVAQGIVGNVPMAALAFQTLYLQLLGIPPSWASAAVSAGFGAHALGGLLGGALGDAAARWSPRHGRVLVCQASVVLGALATLLMLRGLPRGYYQEAAAKSLPPPPVPPPPPVMMKSRAAAAVPAYLAVFILGGLVNAWPAPACNNPVFAEIVPARSRTLVYAFDRSFEMAVAALVGGPLVSLVAMRLFGFSDGEAGASGDPAQDGPKAEALSAALAVSTAVPWAVCALLYNGVHCTYGRDKARVAAQLAAARRLRRASGVGGGGGGGGGVAGGGAGRPGNGNGAGHPLRSPPPLPPNHLPRSGSIDGRPGDCATGGDAVTARAAGGSSQQRGSGKNRSGGGSGV